MLSFPSSSEAQSLTSYLLVSFSGTLEKKHPACMSWSAWDAVTKCLRKEQETFSSQSWRLENPVQGLTAPSPGEGCLLSVCPQVAESGEKSLVSPPLYSSCPSTVCFTLSGCVISNPV